MTATIQPDTESRLEQLAAQYDLAKAEADKAAETLKAITDAIKLELVTAAPGENDIRFDSPQLARPLRLFAVTSRRIDTKRFKTEQPDLYTAYSTESVAWRLQGVAQ